MTSTIQPNHWQGETDCLVGPFQDAETAASFSQQRTDFGQFDAFEERIVVRRDRYYVHVQRVAQRRDVVARLLQ